MRSKFLTSAILLAFISMPVLADEKISKEERKTLMKACKQEIEKKEDKDEMKKALNACVMKKFKANKNEE